MDLQALDAFLKAHGVVSFTAAEIARVGATRHGVTNTMPAPALWPHILPTLHVLQNIRNVIGGPIVVLSGYRDTAYNAEVGGATESMHPMFCAIDWRPQEFEKFHVSDLVRLVDTYGPGGRYIGRGAYEDAHPEDAIKTGFVHLDCRGLVFGHKGAAWQGKI